MPATLGLSTYRWNNNIKSILLLLCFPLLLLALLGGTFFTFGYFTNAHPESGGLSPMLYQSFGFETRDGSYSPLDFAAAAVFQYWPIVTGIAVIWVLVGYLFNDAIIHAATGAKPVTRQEFPKLYNIIENLCISRGMAPPKLYVIDAGELNAYASGLDEKTFSITVTRGLVERLDDQEMEAVLAHELTHIINRDCRLLIVTVVFVGMISFAAQMLWRSMQFRSYGNRGDRRGGGGALFMIIAAVMMLVGYFFAIILRFALSRKREYLADAGSVELTKHPEALISALRKISAAPNVPNVPTEVKQMFIENPPSALNLMGLFATHPPIEDRIKVLQELGGLPPEGQSIIPPTN